MNRARGVRVSHAQVLMDVVFGVIVALPLIEVPRMAVALVTAPTLPGATSLVLQVGALLFCAYNWLEARDFFELQGRFHQAAEGCGVPMEARFPLPMVLLVPALAAGILTHASYEAFRAFVAMNALFWLMDVGTGVWLQRRYAGFDATAHVVRARDEDAYAWYASFMAGSIYVWWSVASLLLFAAMLALDATAGGDPWLRLALAPLVFLPALRGRAAALALRQGQDLIEARSAPAA